MIQNPTFSLSDMTGTLPFTLRNDFMFHYIMQHSKAALIHLICSLKDLKPEEIKAVELLNQLDYSKVDAKIIVLDIRILLNNSSILVVELQCYVDKQFPDRSLLYLCRAFDNLNSGDNYNHLKPASLIAIMNYDMFEDEKEFYSHYVLQNKKTGKIYTPNFSLSVLNLNQIKKATDTIPNRDLVLWAKAILANSWEELAALAKENQIFEEVALMIAEASQDVMLRSALEARKMGIELMAMYKAHQENLEKELAETDKDLAEKKKALAEKNAALAEKDEALAEKDEALAEKDEALAEKDEALAEKDAEIARLKALLAEK